MNKFAYLVAASALAVSAFGQGSIDLSNRGLALVTSAAQPNGITGTSFLAQVWYGASAGALTKSFAPSPFRSSTTAYPGTWNPAAANGPGQIATLDGFAPGSTVTLQVAVWDSAIAGAGAASALAKAAGTGLSETGASSLSEGRGGTSTSDGGVPDGDLQGHSATRSETVEGRDLTRTIRSGRIPRLPTLAPGIRPLRMVLVRSRPSTVSLRVAL